MGGAGEAFAGAFVVVESERGEMSMGGGLGKMGWWRLPLSVLFGPSFDVLVLRLTI